eukprot:Skav204310  [mRNA]  locus=scaffold453:107114:108909:+ [translate_table: standard]
MITVTMVMMPGQWNCNATPATTKGGPIIAVATKSWHRRPPYFESTRSNPARQPKIMIPVKTELNRMGFSMPHSWKRVAA